MVHHCHAGGAGCRFRWRHGDLRGQEHFDWDGDRYQHRRQGEEPEGETDGVVLTKRHLRQGGTEILQRRIDVRQLGEKTRNFRVGLDQASEFFGVLLAQEIITPAQNEFPGTGLR